MSKTLGISRMAMKTLRRIVRITLLSFGILLGVVVIAVMFLVIYLSEPYIEVTEMRSMSVPQTVEVTWYLSCGRDYYDDENKKHYDPIVPTGGVAPGVGPVMSSGTRFVLVGYPYMALHRNIFTGSVKEQRSERFDVVEWHVVTPYHIWDAEKDIESNKPLGWKSDKSDTQFFAQVDQRRKGGC
jgi:hypothetical protein